MREILLVLRASKSVDCKSCFRSPTKKVHVNINCTLSKHVSPFLSSYEHEHCQVLFIMFKIQYRKASAVASDLIVIKR